MPSAVISAISTIIATRGSDGDGQGFFEILLNNPFLSNLLTLSLIALAVTFAVKLFKILIGE